jgi:phosphopentomutase
MRIDRLYEVCTVARQHADQFRIGRVIARPFTGPEGNFARTSRRHDFSMEPPPTILNAIGAAGLNVTAVGKVSDIFAGSGITESFPTDGNAEGMERISERWGQMQAGLIFANLVDFDMLYGHRRDLGGYAEALRAFDQWLGDFLPRVSPSDLVIITADHGNDPTHRGTDHTRERVPLFVVHGEKSGPLGTRETFADIAATLSEYFQLAEPWPVGSSFLSKTSAEPTLTMARQRY